MRIEYHLYQLQFNKNYSTVGQGATRAGALLRVTFEDGLIGYCDCHPWVDLGDLPLPQQLSALRHPDKTPLLNCSLRFARIDAKARRDLRSVFEGLTIPPSHQIVSLTDTLADFVAEGISHFKLKTGKNSDQEISTITGWIEAYPTIRFRLDFNERLSREDFFCYWENIPPKVRRSIDFVEDPYSYDPRLWSEDQFQLGVSFGADRWAARALRYPESAQFIIHKPAVEQHLQFPSEDARLVITTYLDHPLGQMCAAYAAASLKVQYPEQVDFCGLLSHVCYQNGPFVSSVHSKGAYLIPPGGTGFGFNTLLDGLSWQSL